VSDVECDCECLASSEEYIYTVFVRDLSDEESRFFRSGFSSNTRGIVWVDIASGSGDCSSVARRSKTDSCGEGVER